VTFVVAPVHATKIYRAAHSTIYCGFAAGQLNP
jgi:hypothetical protein